jgi:hypothetical protein|tara:strand:+ start:194 stop:487 length:294 start_codon:yes stop_codon:yes gene_type:complete
MKLFKVGNRETIEDSQWRVAADSPAQAAELYVEAMFDEEISVDEGEIEDLGKIEVQANSAEMPSEPGVIQWSDDPITTFQLEDIEAWNKARHSDMEP